MSTATEDIVSLNEEINDSLKTSIEISIKKDVLQSVLKQVERSRQKTGVSPILSGIYLYFEEDKLVARGSNNIYSTQVTIDRENDNFEIVKGKSGGAVIMDQKFTSMVNSMPRKSITLKIEDNMIVISSGRSTYELNALDYLEYPAFEQPEDGLNLTIHPDVLRRLYNKTVFACSQHETRPALCGVNHLLTESRLSLIATDAHRLAQEHTELDELIDLENKESHSYVVPQGSVSEAVKHLGEETERVTITFYDRSIVYNFNNGTIMNTRLIEGAFPDTSRLIPSDHVTEAMFLAGDMKNLIKRSLLADDESPVKMLLNTSNKQVRVLSQTNEKSGFKEDIVPQTSSGDDISLAFNARYLLDALNHQPDHQIIKIQFINNSSPFLIRQDNGKDENLDLVLPVRLRNEKEMNATSVTIEDFSA